METLAYSARSFGSWATLVLGFALASCGADDSGGDGGGASGGTGAATGKGGSSGKGGSAGTGVGQGGSAGVGTGGSSAGVGGSAAGSGGTSGAAGSAGGSAGTGGGKSIIPARCTGDASKTAMIGDSYLALSGEVTTFLRTYSGQTYRTYYVNGTQMVGGANPNIPAQARAAIAAGPTQTIIMTGGGNDVLIGDASCKTAPAGTQCRNTVNGAIAAAKALMDESATKGVQEVIYFFYPHLPGSLLAPVQLNDVLDYSYPLSTDACEKSTVLDCSFIDTRPAFQGHADFIGIDGIHPTRGGSEAIAKLIWAVMQANCMTGVRVP